MRADEFDQLERGADELGIVLSETQKEMFRVYFQELLSWNRRVNLVSRKDETRLITRHFLDSLTGLPYLTPQKGLRVIDVGAGAGFPGLPLKIVRDDLLLTLIESRRKKVLFLRHIIGRLNLHGAEAILGRAEGVGLELNSFDVALSRGVAKLSRLLRLCLPLLRKGGTIIAYKGGGVEEEVAEVLSVLEEVGGESVDVKRVQLPILGGERSLILVRKGS